MERIEALSEPGPKERGKAHTRLRAFGRACTSTDFSRDHQWANTAFSKIVVRWDTRNGHEDKEFREKGLDALAESLHNRRGVHIRSTKVPESLLENMLLCHASKVLLAR